MRLLVLLFVGCLTVTGTTTATSRRDSAADWVLADRAELNHIHDRQTGEYRFSQLILWRWYDTGYHVADWRLTTRYGCRARHFRDTIKLVEWTDSSNQAAKHRPPRWFERRVLAKGFIETFTQYDPERADCEFLPEKQREPFLGEDGPTTIYHPPPTALADRRLPR